MRRFLRWLRDIVPVVVLSTLALVGVGFVWLTSHPDTPWLEKAEEWPAVGEFAKKFRRAYLGPAAQEGAEDEGAEQEEPVEIAETGSGPRSSSKASPRKPANHRQEKRAPDVASEEPKVSSRAPARSRPEESPAASSQRSTRKPPRAKLPPVAFVALEWRWFLPGQPLRSAPQSGAEALGTLAAMAYLPVVDVEGSFARVVYRGQRVWADTLWLPPFSRKKARRGVARARAEPVTASDTTRLRKAQRILGLDKRSPEQMLGAYSLYTDVKDEDLLSLLDSAARQAEDAYFARYGRLPSGNPKRSVVLFSRREGYEQYSEGYFEDADRFAGHAGQGLTTFFAEGNSREQLARTLVHEITHLLNDRALARRLPPWLEEGIASDLGSVWVEGSGAVSREGGAFAGQGWITQGPGHRFAYLEKVLEQGQLPSLAVLMSLDREKFYSEALSRFSYSCSFATIRFFLDADDGRRGELFRKWLKRIAVGQGASPQRLAKDMDGGFEELDANFRVWLKKEAAAYKKSRLEQARDHYARH